MRAATVLLALTLAACATAQRGEDSPLAGSYRLAEINARAVPAESPTEPGVVLDGGTLALEPGGSYVLQISARSGGRPAPTTPTVRGTYQVAGDVLSFTPDDTSVGAAVQFRVVREAGMLRLRDEHGNEFAFARQ